MVRINGILHTRYTVSGLLFHLFFHWQTFIHFTVSLTVPTFFRSCWRQNSCTVHPNQPVLGFSYTSYQARNQLGTPGKAKSFLRGSKFYNDSIYFASIAPTRFSRRAKSFPRGFATLALHLVTGLRPTLYWNTSQIRIITRYAYNIITKHDERKKIHFCGEKCRTAVKPHAEIT